MGQQPEAREAHKKTAKMSFNKILMLRWKNQTFTSRAGYIYYELLPGFVMKSMAAVVTKMKTINIAVKFLFTKYSALSLIVYV